MKLTLFTNLNFITDETNIKQYQILSNDIMKLNQIHTVIRSYYGFSVYYIHSLNFTSNANKIGIETTTRIVVDLIIKDGRLLFE